MSSNPKILNLDELETEATDIGVTHDGTTHYMRVLDVEAFIEQQKRAKKQQKMAQEAESVGDTEMIEVVELVRDSIQEFFPTLPVGKLPTPKLFVIFAWINELSQKVNEIGSPDEGDGVLPESVEGNAAEAENSSS